jgi:class 3 adenylate cyclase
MNANNTNDGLSSLLDTWAARPEAPDVVFYTQVGEHAISLGHNSLAFDMLKEGLAQYAEHPELTYWSALASARGGSTRSAREQVNTVLASLSSEDKLYSEALSLAGRVAKDVLTKSSGSVQRRKAAAESARYYQAAFDLDNDYFPGINAATMTIIGGDSDAGRAIAARVKLLCTRDLENGKPPSHWLLASLGEASLLLGEQNEAVGWYKKAAAAAGQRFGDIASMRRQLKMLTEHIGGTAQILDELQIPGVVVFSGHMIDAPGRPDARFPEAVSSQVREQLDNRLAELNAGFGYCSAACGGDLLFIEAMLARGAEVHVVLPFSRQDFLQTSINFAGPGWNRRFEAALESATSVGYATEEAFLGDTVLFSFTASLLAGMAQLRARQLETAATMLTVLDPDTVRDTGGTLHTLEAWQASGQPAVNIDLKELRADSAGSTAGQIQASDQVLESGTVAITPMRRQIETMMFADIVGFSKLCEASTAAFFVEFLDRVDQVVENCTVKPSFCNTWGDGLFVVFDDAAAAAKFALTLRDMVNTTDWISLGLPVNLDIRVGMHTGPVFQAHDPIIGRDNFFGTQVNRAARIEPIAVPGSVMVSEQCAAMLVESGGDEYTCDYLGVVELAKKFGSGILYRLRRASELE